MSTTELLGERLIGRAALAFPLVEMPPADRLVVDPGHDGEHEDVWEELMGLEGGEPAARHVRGYAQTWYYLQPDTWKWTLARYIPHCVMVDAAADLFATSFLIYALDPGDHPQRLWEKKAAALLATFSVEQIECLIDFVNWAATTEVADQDAERIGGALACLGRARAAHIASESSA